MEKNRMMRKKAWVDIARELKIIPCTRRSHVQSQKKLQWWILA